MYAFLNIPFRFVYFFRTILECLWRYLGYMTLSFLFFCKLVDYLMEQGLDIVTGGEGVDNPLDTYVKVFNNIFKGSVTPL